jgi:DNA-directed RNA polymerase specialized sigma24 family protein
MFMTASETLTLEERRRKLAAARLSGQQTRVLTALATANSAAEAAQRLGLTITALKMRRSRARAKLAKVGVMLADGRKTMGRGRHRTYAGLPAGI